ncbi:MAG: ABC transporter permease [Spirochaetota bacterium]
MKVKLGKRLLRQTEIYLFAMLVVLGSFLTAVNPRFISLENLLDLLRTNAFYGILALGELVVLISGGIDVSFTAVATVAQYIMGLIISKYFIDNILITFIIPIPIGIMLGALNAVIIHYSRVHPVIITIATLNAFYGLLIFITGGTWIYSFPPSFMNFAGTQIFKLTSARETTYGLSIFIAFWMAVALLTWSILRFFSIGRKVYAMGGNLEAARRAGFNIFRLHLFVYCFMGALAGIASFVHAELNQIIQPNAIVGRELDVLAAPILGGASVFGGAGTVPGVILGVILIGVIRNGLILMEVSSYWHQVVIGMVIVAAAGVSAYQRLLRARREEMSIG